MGISSGALRSIADRKHVRDVAPARVAVLIAVAMAGLVSAGHPAFGGDGKGATGALIASPASHDCPKCPEWTVPQKPFKVYGNTYYVGTRELASILVTSSEGHVLIDGTVGQAVPQVAANIRALGFRVEDIRWILNSHDHFDHAGGIAALKRMSGAKVAASPPSAHVLSQGHSDPDDPLYGSLARGPEAIPDVRIIGDGDAISAGPLKLTAHFTPGHTPGGTSWTWQSCEKDRCLHIVYADSLSPVSSPSFKFTRSATYPRALEDFAHSFEVLSALPCDILLTPHPDFSDTLERLARREGGSDPDAFVDSTACRRYVEEARADLQKRVAQEGRPR